MPYRTGVGGRARGGDHHPLLGGVGAEAVGAAGGPGASSLCVLCLCLWSWNDGGSGWVGGLPWGNWGEADEHAQKMEGVRGGLIGLARAHKPPPPPPPPLHKHPPLGTRRPTTHPTNQRKGGPRHLPGRGGGRQERAAPHGQGRLQAAPAHLRTCWSSPCYIWTCTGPACSSCLACCRPASNMEHPPTHPPTLSHA